MKNKKLIYRIFIVMIIFSLFGMAIRGTYALSIKKISFDEFQVSLQNGEIATVISQANGENVTLSGEYVNNEDVKNYKTEVINSDLINYSIIEYTSKNDISYEQLPPKKVTFLAVILNLIPLMLIIFVVYFIYKQMEKQGSMASKFAGNKAKLNTFTGVKFDNVAGYEEEKEELVEVVEFLKKPKKFSEMGAKIPKGIMLEGPPGTGKTLLAKAVAGEANVHFFSISGSEFVEMYVGVGASRVRNLFKDAHKNKPCIVFIDEIDAVGRKRGSGQGGGNDEREQTLNQILTEMDGFETNSGIVVIAATNRIDVLDSALVRPGRFDRKIKIGLPDLKTRKEILKLHAQKVKYSPNIDFDEMAKNTSGMSGADLANVINEAAIMAVRFGKNGVGKKEISEALDRVFVGTAKKSRKYIESEKKLVSYHEVGHVIIGKVLDDANQVQKVTIIPRGDAGGYASFAPKDERFFTLKSHFLDEITGLLGGRASEEIFIGEISSGAHNDLERATRIARSMVTELGMTELGIYQFVMQEDKYYGGVNHNYSEETAKKIDQKISDILDECYAKAKSILTEYSDTVHIMAEFLREDEVLDRTEIDHIFETKTFPEKVLDDDVEYNIPDNELNRLKGELNSKLKNIQLFQKKENYPEETVIFDDEIKIYEDYYLFVNNMNTLTENELTEDEQKNLKKFKEIENKLLNTVTDVIYKDPLFKKITKNEEARRKELKIIQTNQIKVKVNDQKVRIINEIEIEYIIKIEELILKKDQKKLSSSEQSELNKYYDLMVYLHNFINDND